jgi:hypothetical protein
MPDSHTLGDGPIQEMYRDKMNRLAGLIDLYFNGDDGDGRTTGFVLLLFEFNKTGRANYISNADRDDVVKMLKEQIALFESQSAEGRA